MNIEEARKLVLEAFDEGTYYYSQVTPFGYTNWIDGMAWVGLLCGASHKVNDVELAQKCELYLGRLLEIGEDARNFAPMQVANDWFRSAKVTGYWYKKKPQSFAGPAALRFAIDSGAHLNDPFGVKGTARLYVRLGWFFGHGAKFIKWLRQHINSVFLAHLILEKRPAKSMLWMCEGNPFFSFIAGEKCEVEYPSLYRTSEGHSEDEDEIVPLKDRKPNSWIFRNWPKSRYVRDGTIQTTGYTPIWQVVAYYLQSTLR